MNFDELQKDWNSPRNDLSNDTRLKLAEAFSRRMVRRRRVQVIWLTYGFVVLSLVVGLAAVSINSGKTDPLREWSLAPLLIVPWGFAIVLFRDLSKSGRGGRLGEVSVSDALKAALVSNLNAQTRSKWVGGLYVVMAPLLVLALHQLHAVGKVSERELVSMATFFGAVLLVCGTVLVVRFYRRLRPEQRQLEHLLDGS